MIWSYRERHHTEHHDSWAALLTLQPGRADTASHVHVLIHQAQHDRSRALLPFPAGAESSASDPDKVADKLKWWIRHKVDAVRGRMARQQKENQRIHLPGSKVAAVGAGV